MINYDYIDIGVNLFCKQFREPENVLKNAAEKGVFCILTGSDMRENEAVSRFVKTHDCAGTCGIHPHNADHAAPQDFQRIRELLKTEQKLVAVGECGLDYDRMFSSKKNQLSCLEEHIKIAEELQKPMFLHEREAAEDFLAVFAEHKEICKHAVVHCFTGDRATLERYLSLGFYIGITGWICDERRGDALRDAAAILPPERVMVETDAPYLTPRNIKGLGRVNVPQNVEYVAEELARHMQIEKTVLRQQLKENTRRFFGL